MRVTPENLKTIGQILGCLSFISLIWPLKLLSRGVDPSFRLYQEAKGSWAPAVYWFENPTILFITAAILGLLSVIMFLWSAFLEKLHQKNHKE
jgi:hypothetical protein